MSTLVGFKRFTSKKGQKYCVANLVSDYSARELEFDNFGQKIEEVWLPVDLYDLLTPADIGKTVTLNYEIISGKAYLSSFVVNKNNK